jgi:hypothetical protein
MSCDRQRRIEVAGELSGVQHPHLRVALLVGLRRQLVGHGVRDDRRVVARGEDRGTDHVELVRALARRLQQLVAVVDRRLVPDEDALLVEAVEQTRVEQVVRARDVHAERLELLDRAVDVGIGHRRPAPGDVLLDRGAAQVQRPPVEAQHPVADVDGAQPDVALVDLHDLPARARRDRARVAVRMLG